MADLVTLLDRYYHISTNQQGDWGFFRALADYVQFIEDTPEIEKIADKYNHQRIRDQKNTKEIGKRVLLEVQDAKERLKKIIKKGNISFKELSDAEREYDNLLNSRTITSNPLVDALYNALRDILGSLVQNGHKDLLKEFVTTVDYQGQQLIDKYIFAPSVQERENEEYKLKEKEAVELWGDWNKLSDAYLVIVKGVEYWERLQKTAKLKNPEGGKAQLEMLGFATVMREMKNIREGSKERNFLFIRKEYESSLGRIHTNLIAQLSMQKRTDKNPSNKIVSITFVKKGTRERPTYGFYINGDVENMKLLRQDSSRIRKLIAVADGQNVVFDKDLLDYINSNKDCALYCAGKYDLSKVLERNGNILRIVSGVKAKAISEIAYKKEANRKKPA